MTVPDRAFDRLREHWAIQAVGTARNDRAREVAQYLLVSSALKSQVEIKFDFDKVNDPQLVERVATAYELAAVEGFDAYLFPPPSAAAEEGGALREQMVAGAYVAYELYRALPVPSGDASRVYHVLHLAALSYAGERWNDLRRWLRENASETATPSSANAAWDQRVLFRIFECWIRLFRKSGWDDLSGVREIIAGLRQDQAHYEASLLDDEQRDPRDTAYQLIALYHWARGTEILGTYVLQGAPSSGAINPMLDQHFEAARQAAVRSADGVLELLLRWLHVAARRMVGSSIWSAATISSDVRRFVEHVTTSARPMFELLPPQQAALQEQGLLDQAYDAVVVNLPTSGGKTILAQFRILQALNQFKEDGGYVAYVAPTRALVSQITRRLRRDFEPLGIVVEQLTGAVDIDTFEEEILSASGGAQFDVLVMTPEKMSLVVRNQRVKRPLALLVLDEAHNIEDSDRGLRIELLLATVKRDCPKAKFLLLMPHVPNGDDLARWLAPATGRTISMSSTVWQPNERLVGVYDVEPDKKKASDWRLTYRTLTTSPRTIHLKGRHRVGGKRPVPIPTSKAKSLSAQTAGMAAVMSQRGTAIAVGRTINDAWSMARLVCSSLPTSPVDPDVALVQRFLSTEISPDFELIGMLDHGVAVHHAGLSDETRGLIEWLAETEKLRVLCATTTIAQGINFPVSSVFLSTLKQYVGIEGGGQRDMPPRSFWNLAGRAGRIDHDSVGVVGIAGGTKPEEIASYVSQATGDLISRLVTLLDGIEQTRLGDLKLVMQQEQWTDFRSYIAHLWNEKKELESFVAESEQILRNTYGYSLLKGDPAPTRRAKAAALLEATKQYARDISGSSELATLADATGFSPEGVRIALGRLSQQKLKPSDWQAGTLFGGGSVLPKLVGVMMNIPQIRRSMADLGSVGNEQKHVADIAQAWVAGASIAAIAKKYFASDGSGPEAFTEAVTHACRGIYKTLTTAATWGLAALSKMPTSGIDFETLTDDDRRALNTLPAMLYHGVSTEAAVLMRMNSVPRSIASNLGERFEKESSSDAATARHARSFLKSLTDDDWASAAPPDVAMSGSDYRAVWSQLTGTT